MPNMHELPERFLEVLRPPRKIRRDRKTGEPIAPKPPIDDEEYGAMLMRMIRAWEARVIENPQMLAVNVVMARRFAEITNVAIAANAERYAIDERRGASMAECARILEISKPAASERRARGVAIMAERIEQAGAIRFSEAVREREAIEQSREHAVAYLADYLARKAG